MKTLRKTIGERILEARSARRPRMSRGRLSEILGVDPATIYRWEKGIFLPSEENLKTISKALDVNLMEDPKPINEGTDMIINKLNKIERHLVPITNPLEKESIEIISALPPDYLERALTFLRSLDPRKERLALRRRKKSLP